MLKFIIRSFLILLMTCTTALGQIQDSCHILSETEEDSLRTLIQKLHDNKGIEVEIITQPYGDPLTLANDTWETWNNLPHSVQPHIVLSYTRTDTFTNYRTAVYGMRGSFSEQEISTTISLLKNHIIESPAAAFQSVLLYLHMPKDATGSNEKNTINGWLIGFIIIIIAIAAFIRIFGKRKEGTNEYDLFGLTIFLPDDGNGSGCSSDGGCSSGCSSGCGGCGGGGCGS